MTTDDDDAPRLSANPEYTLINNSAAKKFKEQVSRFDTDLLATLRDDLYAITFSYQDFTWDAHGNLCTLSPVQKRTEILHQIVTLIDRLRTTPRADRPFTDVFSPPLEVRTSTGHHWGHEARNRRAKDEMRTIENLFRLVNQSIKIETISADKLRLESPSNNVTRDLVPRLDSLSLTGNNGNVVNELWAVHRLWEACEFTPDQDEIDRVCNAYAAWKASQQREQSDTNTTG